MTLRGPWGWTLFGVVWGLAVIGGVQELRPIGQARIVSVVIYLVMGWAALAALVPLLRALGTAGFAWVATGGACYTLGIVFYALDSRLSWAHGVWHLFVIAGSAINQQSITGRPIRRIPEKTLRGFRVIIRIGGIHTKLLWCAKIRREDFKEQEGIGR